jgi:hypothetical protein
MTAVRYPSGVQASDILPKLAEYVYSIHHLLFRDLYSLLFRNVLP